MITLKEFVVAGVIALPSFACAQTASEKPVPLVKPIAIQAVSASQQKMVIIGEMKVDSAVVASSDLTQKALKNLRRNITAGFVQSRKLAVLDREFGDQTTAEKRTTNIDRSVAGQTVKQGQEATADLLISGSVQSFSGSVSEQKMKLSDNKFDNYKFDFAISIQVIDVVSRRVVFADVFKEASVGRGLPGKMSFDIWLDTALQKIADRSVAAVLEAVYPLKVAAITPSGEIILNEGGTRVKQDDIFDVYAVGAPIVDPDTGAELGKQETLQAQIKVSRVLPKAAYAEILSPAGAKVTPGSICRHPLISPDKASTEKSPAEGAPAKKAKATSEDLY